MAVRVKQDGIGKLVWTVGLNILAIAGILFTLYQTREIVAWMLIALLFALALDPAVLFLERHGFKRGIAVGAIVLTLVGFIAVLFSTVVPVLVHQGHNLIESAPGLIDQVRENPSFKWANAKLHVLDPIGSEWSNYARAAAPPLLKMVQGVFSGVFGMITTVVLTVFMLVAGRPLFGAALEWIPPGERERYVMLAGKIRLAVGRYVIGTLMIACLGGFVAGTTLAVLGVPYFLPLGFTMILLGVVPFIGAILGGTLVVGTTFLTVGAKAGFIALGVFLLYQQCENHLLQPVVQRKTIQMNPLLIIIVMLIGTGLAGIFGALLSLPTAAAIQVVLQDVLERRRAKQRPPRPPMAPHHRPVPAEWIRGKLQHRGA
ncbi:MAG: AI-2E family transporter [Myxococcales bacterium]